MLNGCQGQIVLGFEVVEEAALGDASFLADIVYGSGGVAFRADGMERCIEQVQPGYRGGVHD
jgi:hypothetical protein